MVLPSTRNHQLSVHPISTRPRFPSWVSSAAANTRLMRTFFPSRTTCLATRMTRNPLSVHNILRALIYVQSHRYKTHKSPQQYTVDIQRTCRYPLIMMDTWTQRYNNWQMRFMGGDGGGSTEGESIGVPNTGCAGGTREVDGA